MGISINVTFLLASLIVFWIIPAIGIAKKHLVDDRFFIRQWLFPKMPPTLIGFIFMYFLLFFISTDNTIFILDMTGIIIVRKVVIFLGYLSFSACRFGCRSCRFLN